MIKEYHRCLRVEQIPIPSVCAGEPDKTPPINRAVDNTPEARTDPSSKLHRSLVLHNVRAESRTKVTPTPNLGIRTGANAIVLKGTSTLQSLSRHIWLTAGILPFLNSID